MFMAPPNFASVRTSPPPGLEFAQAAGQSIQRFPSNGRCASVGPTDDTKKVGKLNVLRAGRTKMVNINMLDVTNGWTELRAAEKKLFF